MSEHQAKRPDRLDELNAFRAGFREGRDGPAGASFTNREAWEIMEKLGLRTDGDMTTCFQNGHEDGVRGDAWRYVLSFIVRVTGDDLDPEPEHLAAIEAEQSFPCLRSTPAPAMPMA